MNIALQDSQTSALLPMTMGDFNMTGIAVDISDVMNSAQVSYESKVGVVFPDDQVSKNNEGWNIVSGVFFVSGKYSEPDSSNPNALTGGKCTVMTAAEIQLAIAKKAEKDQAALALQQAKYRAAAQVAAKAESIPMKLIDDKGNPIQQ